MAILKSLILDYLGKRFDNLGWRAVAPTPTLRPGTRILLLQMDGKLGDSVLLSSLLAPLRRRFPDGEVIVATTYQFERYWSSNPLVGRVLVIPARGEAKLRLWKLWNILHGERGNFDVCVLFEPFITADSLLAVRAAGAKLNVGFVKEHYRLFHISLHDYTFHWRKRPIDSRVREVLAALGADEDAELRGYTGIAEEGKGEAKRIMGESVPMRIFLNAFGTAQESCFSQAHLKQIIEALFSGAFGEDVAIFLNLPSQYPPEQIAELEALGGPGRRVVRLPYPLQMPVLFSIISSMQLVISPDTGIVHVAAAMDIPQVAVYPELAFKGTVWRAQSAQACILIPQSETNVNDVPVSLIVNGALGKLDRRKESIAMT